MSDKPETGATDATETPQSAEALANEPVVSDPNAQDEPQTLEEAREALRVARAAHAQAKAEKSTLEASKQRTAELEQELETLKRGVSPPTNDPRVANQEAKLARLASTMQDWQIRADNGDRDAELMLESLKETYAQNQHTLAELQLSRIKDDAEQEGTRQAMKKYRVTDVAMARKLYLGDRFEAEQNSITQKQRELDEDAEKRRNGKVSTATVGHSRKAVEEDRMTYRQFARNVDKLRAQGKKDEADALVNDIRKHPERLVPGG